MGLQQKREPTISIWFKWTSMTRKLTFRTFSKKIKCNHQSTSKCSAKEKKLLRNHLKMIIKKAFKMNISSNLPSRAIQINLLNPMSNLTNRMIVSMS